MSEELEFRHPLGSVDYLIKDTGDYLKLWKMEPGTLSETSVHLSPSAQRALRGLLLGFGNDNLGLISSSVWGEDGKYKNENGEWVEINVKNIRDTIRELRIAFSDSDKKNRVVIETIRGVGYKWMLDKSYLNHKKVLGPPIHSLNPEFNYSSQKISIINSLKELFSNYFNQKTFIFFIISIVVAFIFLFIFFMMPTIYNKIDQHHLKDKNYIADFSLGRDDSGLISQIYLINTEGKRLRSIWFRPRNWDKNDSFFLERYGIFSKMDIAPLNKSTETIALDCLNQEEPKLHTSRFSRKISIPDLTVETYEEIVDDIKMVECINWIETPVFDGWIFTINSKNNFSGCLLLLDHHFQIVGKVFHPGYLYEVFHLGNSLFVSCTLNAREIKFAQDGKGKSGLYRPALFKINLDKIVKKSTQILPFSEITIPTLSRRNHYRIKNIPEITPEIYLALAPAVELRYRPLLKKIKGDEIIISINYFDFSQTFNLTFNTNLELKRKWVQDDLYTGDFTADYFSTRFQYWLGESWSSWIIDP